METNFANYKLKLIQQLKHFKIPESEYSFNGEIYNNCLFVEHDENFWRVCITHNNEKIIRGIFHSEATAYDFLFYLVMKRHVPLKKRWF